MAKYEAPRVAPELMDSYVSGWLESLVREIASGSRDSRARQSARASLEHLSDLSRHIPAVGGTHGT